MAPVWWQTFFDENYLHLWSQVIPPEKTESEATGLWNLLALRAGSRLLDAPCGYGRLSLPLARRGASVVGVAPLGTGLRIVVRRHACDEIELLLARLDAPAERVRPSFEDLFLARIESEESAARPEARAAP